MMHTQKYEVTLINHLDLDLSETLAKELNNWNACIENKSVDVRLLSSEAIDVIYPDNVSAMTEINITFTERVSKDTVESAIAYCYAIPYFGELLNIAWTNATTCIVSCESAPSSSRHNILHELKDTIEHGPRSGKFAGIGVGKVSLIRGIA